MRDEDIDLSDIPEVTEEQMARVKLRIGGKPDPRDQVRVVLLLGSYQTSRSRKQSHAQD